MNRRSALAAAAACFAGFVIGLAVYALSVHWLGVYGWAIFVAVPVTMGYASVWAANRVAPVRGKGEAVRIAVLSMLAACALAIAVAIEGAICVLMVLPLALPLSAAGGCLAQATLSRRALPPMALLPPILASGEFIVGPPPKEWAVRTEVIAAAPPDAVWRHVVAFEQLPPPRELLFRAGVAYPIRAEIRGSGPGAIRRCVFSTGAFVEPITVWDEPRKLAFDVADQPATMRELSPWDVDAPHLRGYFKSTRGQFVLTPLPGGKTLLEGTTWYSNRLAPEFYWRLWTEYLLHAIHERVLHAIARRAEASLSVKDLEPFVNTRADRLPRADARDEVGDHRHRVGARVQNFERVFASNPADRNQRAVRRLASRAQSVETGDRIGTRFARCREHRAERDVVHRFPGRPPQLILVVRGETKQRVLADHVARDRRREILLAHVQARAHQESDVGPVVDNEQRAPLAAGFADRLGLLEALAGSRFLATPL